MKFISISFFQHSGHDDRQLPDTSKEDVWFSIFQLTCLLKQMARKYTTFYNDLLWKEYMWRPNGTNFFHLKIIYDLEETGLSLLYIKIYIYLICLMYLLSKVLSFWEAYFGNNLFKILLVEQFPHQSRYIANFIIDNFGNKRQRCGYEHVIVLGWYSEEDN